MKAIEKYFEKYKIRYFLEFPETSICPICGKNEKDYCVLIGIDGTSEEGNIEQAIPVHVHCLIHKDLRYNKEVNIIYHKLLR